MKVLTLLGTRPELIRLSRIIPLLDKHCTQIVVDTQQNYDDNLSGIFYRELGIRQPDYELGARGSLGQQMAAIFTGLEEVLLKEKPDRFLVLGDTNSSLGSIVAARLNVPVFHMEAGNRSHNPQSPEEVNRRLIDHCATIHMPYTERSRQNLLLEGIPIHRTYVTGNPIAEVMDYYGQEDRFAEVAARLNLDEPFFLATAHRQENVDSPARLKSIVEGLVACRRRFDCPVLVSTHPRTRARLTALYGAEWPKEITFLEPLGFLDFLSLEKHARLILSDSGTISEESCILGVPGIILRDSTERPETIEAGCNILSGVDPESILRCAEIMLGRTGKFPPAPEEYLRLDVSKSVVNVVLGRLL